MLNSKSENPNLFVSIPQGLVLNRNKYHLKFNEIYFSKRMQTTAENGLKVYIQAKCDYPSAHSRRVFTTRIVELCQSEDNIFSNFNGVTRNEIRQSERSGHLVFTDFNASDKHIDEFAVCYNRFARLRKLPACSIEKLLELQRKNALLMSRICSTDGDLFCYHVYVVFGDRARLLYSCSNHLEVGKDEKKTIAKMNRRLHWSDICELKTKGLFEYDLGGIGQPQIAEFKKGFGGNVVDEYNYIVGSGPIAGSLASLAGMVGNLVVLINRINKSREI